MSFNSIKVRLEQVNSEEAHAARVFQFHKGAIRTPPLVGIPRLQHVSIP